MKYKPQQFSNIYHTTLGSDLWSFLTREDNILRMLTASELHRPAVEAIATRLTEKFGDKIKEDRIKRMIGHMVRQIMENQGFILAGQNVRVRVGELFSFGSKYRENKIN